MSLKPFPIDKELQLIDKAFDSHKCKRTLLEVFFYTIGPCRDCNKRIAASMLLAIIYGLQGFIAGKKAV